MQSLRRSTMLIRWVLAWFVVALGVAIAAPAVKVHAMELVCTANGGPVLIVMGDDDAQERPPGHHDIECAMCLAVTPPPSPPRSHAQVPQPLARASHPVAAAHIAALVGAPLPPRGPPSRA